MSNAFKFKYKGTKVHTLVDLYTKEAEDMADMVTKKAHGWVVRLIMEGYGRKHAEKRTLMLVDMGIGPFQDMEWQIRRMTDALYKEVVAEPIKEYARQNPEELLLWKLGRVKTDHCSDCITLSTLKARTIKGWKNVMLKEGGRRTGLPREGKTKCSYGCKCMLKPTGKLEPLADTREKTLREEKKKKEETGTKGVAKSELRPNMCGKHLTVREAEAWATHNFTREDGRPLVVDYSQLNDPDMANGFNLQLKQLYEDFPNNDLEQVMAGEINSTWMGLCSGGSEITIQTKFANQTQEKADEHYIHNQIRRFHPETIRGEKNPRGYRKSVLTHEFGHVLSWRYVRQSNSWAYLETNGTWAEGMPKKLREAYNRYLKDVKAFNKRWGEPHIYKPSETRAIDASLDYLYAEGGDNRGNWRKLHQEMAPPGKDKGGYVYAPSNMQWHSNNPIRKPATEGGVLPFVRGPYYTQSEVDAFVAERDEFYLSKYAEDDLDEFVAEAVCQHFNGVQKSPYAREVYEILKEHYAKRTGKETEQEQEQERIISEERDREEWFETGK